MVDDDSETLERVKEMILEHRGANDPITSREISERLEKEEVGSFPETRALIRELVSEEEIPIAGSSNGYFVIETEEELKHYMDNLESRILGMTERRAYVKRAVVKWDGEIEESDDYDVL